MIMHHHHADADAAAAEAETEFWWHIVGIVWWIGCGVVVMVQ